MQISTPPRPYNSRWAYGRRRHEQPEATAIWMFQSHAACAQVGAQLPKEEVRHQKFMKVTAAPPEKAKAMVKVDTTTIPRGTILTQRAKSLREHDEEVIQLLTIIELTTLKILYGLARGTIGKI